MAGFYYSDGKVQVENPDQEIPKKMYSIAQVLGTKVQGEECETYNRNGEPEVPSIPESKDKWWKFWK